MSDFPKAFPGTKHYRSVAKRREDRVEELGKKGWISLDELDLSLSTIDVSELCDHIENQNKEVEILREALKFYADETNWTPWWWKGLERIPEAVEDDGDKAREALKVSGEE